MFGYVNVYRDELKVKDYLNFRAYYCGLCHAMGKRCSQTSRLGLSYDMTFLAVLLSSMSPRKPVYKEKPCMAHPFHKRKFIISDPCIDYAADASAILYYCKLKDDLMDEHSIKALIGCMGFYGAYKKAAKRLPELAKVIKTNLDALSELEKRNSSDIDMCADCFARITEKLFSPDFAKDNKRPAAWLGYNIGRWIYIIDAFADIEKDYKHKSFNPFLSEYKDMDIAEHKNQLKKNLEITLTFTLENAASAFELMKICKNGEILKNILYESLKLKQDTILNKTKDVD